ncbi:MAG: phage Gp37/Gp68 family protein [Steroidobacteraceae bacterium]
MAEQSGISWCDATFNPWIGCTRVSPACAHCYAERWAARFGRVEWDGPPVRTSATNWRQPLAWNTNAVRLGRGLRVFCASLGDVFDNAAPDAWRADLWALIQATPALTWLLLTKRIGNVQRMLPPAWLERPLPNVWLGATVVNQEEADRDIPKLIAVPAAAHFVSCEPLLGPIDFDHEWLEAEYFGHADDCDDEFCALNADEHSCAGQVLSQPSINWVIVGGESGPEARPMHPEWVRAIRDQCVDARVPFHFKQWGEWAPNCLCDSRNAHQITKRPEPGKMGVMFRCGTRRAGRELDGKAWTEFPVP